MLKKIFLGFVFVVVAILIINQVSASSRANNANIVDSIAEFKPVSNGAQEYKAVETKIEIISDAKIKSKSLAMLKPVSKTAVNTKTSAPVKTLTKKISTAKRASVVKTVVKAPVKTRVTSYHSSYKYGTTMRWDAASLRFLGNIAAFDYSYSIRANIIRKIEAYARAHHISTVTMSMMDAMTY